MPFKLFIAAQKMLHCYQQKHLTFSHFIATQENVSLASHRIALPRSTTLFAQEKSTQNKILITFLI